jgi:hypothetical protein
MPTLDHLKVLAAVLQRVPASLAETMVCNELLEWLARQIEQAQDAGARSVEPAEPDLKGNDHATNPDP